MFVNKQGMGGSLATLFLLVTLYLSLYCHGETDTHISAEEDIELEKKLQILNKPPIKTFQDGPNDIIDCIDINKQPAFDHPLLKSHRIQMKPSFSSKNLMDKRSSTSKHRILSVKSFECPQGTVPIRRTRKEELVQAKSFHQFYHKNPNQQTTDLHMGDLPGRHVARVISREALPTYKIYTGVEGSLNLQNPDVNGDQWSSVQLWVENVTIDHRSIIQAGWAVSPKFLGDEKTRIYIYWEVSESGKPIQGCLNLQCPGFVQVDQSHPINMFFPNISAYGGILYEFPLSIQQDNITRHWWLRGIKNPNKPIEFGYWPNSLFPNLPNVGPRVAWGGMVMGTDTNGASPPMGNGYFPNNDFTTSCYTTFVQVQYFLNDTGGLIKTHPYRNGVVNDVDSSKCYNLVNYPDSPPETGWATMFGGPGGSNC